MTAAGQVGGEGMSLFLLKEIHLNIRSPANQKAGMPAGMPRVGCPTGACVRRHFGTAPCGHRHIRTGACGRQHIGTGACAGRRHVGTTHQYRGMRAPTRRRAPAHRGHAKPKSAQTRLANQARVESIQKVSPKNQGCGGRRSRREFNQRS